MGLLSASLRASLAAGVLFFSGCAGYQLGASRPAAMEGVRTVAVPVFHNETQIPRSSVLITNRVISQFQTDGSYRVVDARQADVIVRGTIKPLRRTQLRADRYNTLRTLEQEVRLVLEYSVESRTGAVLTAGRVEGESSFVPDANWQRSESQSLDEAAARMAANLVSRLTEGWGSADLPPPVPAAEAASPARERLRFR
jgi:hypothetical protein